ncbi:MAG: hypothetical protein HRU69_11305 [Flammeovirgaceae bacterium]|nr:MAG: hypothetical protein HRU69_11305 [Flammeovirgaceae bacterium]
MTCTKSNIIHERFNMAMGLVKDYGGTITHAPTIEAIWNTLSNNGAVVFTFGGVSGINNIYLVGGITATDRSPGPLIASQGGFAPWMLAGWQQGQTQEGPQGPKFYYDAIHGMVLNDGKTLSRDDVALSFDPSPGNATYLGFKNGKHHVNFNIEDFEITKGNIRALMIHEIFGHGVKGYGDKTNDHYKAYWASIDSKYWSSTTDQFRIHTAEGLWLTWTRIGNYDGMPTKYMNVIYQYHPSFR